MASRMQAFLLILLVRAIPTAQAMSAPKECYQPWYDPDSSLSSNEQCPYGISLPGSVTWHDDMNGFKRIFNVFYGYMAFLVPIVVGIFALKERGTREVLFILSIVICVVFNEYGLKFMILEPKPLGNCANTCGMPSGHAWTTIQYYVLLMIDYGFRLNPQKHMETDAFQSMGLPKRILNLMSNSNVDVISVREYCIVAFIWALFLVPVPFSRVWNKDHTAGQCLIGSTIGIFCGLGTFGLYWILGRTVCSTAWRWPREGKYHLLKNTIVRVGSETSSAAPAKPESVPPPQVVVGQVEASTSIPPEPVCDDTTAQV